MKLKKVEKEKKKKKVMVGAYLFPEDIENIKKFGGGRFMTGMARIVDETRDEVLKEIGGKKCA